VNPSNADNRGRKAFRQGALIGLLGVALAGGAPALATEPAPTLERAQVPTWSQEDMAFFLHGSMGTEVFPEAVLDAFRRTYPELLPGSDLSAFGLLTQTGGDLAVGVSRREVPHLGGLSSIGINCAACHVAEIRPRGGGAGVRVLGAAAHFDPEALFGAVIAATFQTLDVGNMSRFLTNYLEVCDAQASAAARARLASELTRQREQIAAAIAEYLAEATSSAATGAARGTTGQRLYDLDRSMLTLDGGYLERHGDLAPLVRSLLRLFHNMRAALHVPQQPPAEPPPRSGPGRNNAFGVLSIALFGEPTLYGPAKFGLVWNLERRTWVHWDGNTRSPIIRNVAASLGLGAPLVGKRGMLDYALVDRHTRLSEKILAPRYPWKIDTVKAERGRRHFDTQCASCHVRPQGTPESLYTLDEVGTDANRAKLFTEHQAEMYNQFFSELEIPGYHPPREPPVRSTGRYVAVDLAGVWARSPYLHNGSVRTMLELLKPGPQRAASFRRGAREYDDEALGFVDGGPYVFDASSEGNTNAGHEYGVELSDEAQRELLEFLKTL
jgi:hypothetical protein